MLRLKNINTYYGKVHALKNVSLTVDAGEIVSLLGGNACGKSTTMKMLTGLLPATEGWARLFGSPMAAGDMEMRRNVGYMSQAFSLYGELTVRQNLELHAQLYHLPADKVGARIGELLERYDLRGVVDKRPESLPLGLKQRLAAVLADGRDLALQPPGCGGTRGLSHAVLLRGDGGGEPAAAAGRGCGRPAERIPTVRLAGGVCSAAGEGRYPMGGACRSRRISSGLVTACP